ncbi:hypothetical protein ACG83_20790 [Frankia sp. R43]|uniref:CaiB/BaiF CoA transferase family protein n=1 Tax=Frankia sp. R43 TaxID=269536 RepID=UPI0006CA36EA|nr:CoA transferase [Frankia sp. R43]KPM54370.1 hypothetical protein ACG83_20790 [Frankia sp. R43]
MSDTPPPGPLAGIRVVELAEWVFVPTVGALLADLGADVVKIEHMRRGDPYRSLRTHGQPPDVGVQMTNRGKRSVALDLKNPLGLNLFWELLGDADVLLTNFRPAAAERLGITAEEVHRRYPRVVLARGSGFGRRGPDRDTPGYDLTAFYARGGLAQAFAGQDAPWPPPMPGAIGDRTAAVALSYGVCAALLRAHRTGMGSTVDVSLLGMAAWFMSADLMRAASGMSDAVDHGRGATSNPLVNFFATADGRWVSLCLLESDRYWPRLVELLGVPGLAADPRFVDHHARAREKAACLAELDAAFARHTLADIRALFSDFDAPWAAVQSADEIVQDPQVVANGYVTRIEERGVPTVRGPVTVDDSAPALARAPEFGEHTELVLLECGKTWEDIAAYQSAGAIP